MIFEPNPPTWVGLAIRRADGTVEAFEFSADQLLDLVIHHEVEVDEAWEIAGRVTPGRSTYEMTLTACGMTYWQRGAEQVPEPPSGITAAPLALAASGHDEERGEA